MNAQTPPAPATPLESRSLVVEMAHHYGMEPRSFVPTIKATLMPKEASMEDVAVFLMIANKYKLNPFLREIYAFPKKGGGIQTIVGVDGWSNLINSHPQFNGADFTLERNPKDGKVEAITCKIWRKDRERPVAVTEYLAECKRNTDMWGQWPMRMLRHRAYIQCGRYAFGFAGLLDPDEVDFHDMRDVTPRNDGRDAGPPLPDESSSTEHTETSPQTTLPSDAAEKGAPEAGGDATPDSRAAGPGAPAQSDAKPASDDDGELFEQPKSTKEETVAKATKAGWDAHAAGHARKALPGVMRAPERADEADAWLLGWDRYGEAQKGAGGTDYGK